MSEITQDLLDRYFDDMLTADEFATLERWIRSSPENATAFASAALFHDQLTTAVKTRHALEVVNATDAADRQESESHADVFIDGAADLAVSTPPLPRAVAKRRWTIAAMTSLALTVTFALLIWPGSSERSASAATAELDRLIAAALDSPGHVYRFDVEEIRQASSPSPRRKSPEETRPPKPPLEGAMLYVRGANRFVLQHRLPDGQTIVTGADGSTSWSVRLEGPVRVSSDVTHFQRDVPGHEHAMSLTHLDQALEQLRRAYDIQVLPTENDDAAPDSEPTRLLVAVRRKGERGPRRVEISYGATSRAIRQFRFVDMPYGPNRLTLRLTVVESRQFTDDFFRHDAHHAADRDVSLEP